MCPEFPLMDIYLIHQVHLEDVVKVFRDLDLDNLFGVIGPYTSTEVQFWAPVFQHRTRNLLTVSDMIGMI